MSQDVYTNALGGTQTITRDDLEGILQGSLGQGISSSFQLVAEFLMDLLRDQSPIIRINPRREVDVVIRTGVELITDDYKWTGVVESSHLSETEAILAELKGLGLE
jgi:hypothetical protein